MQSKKEAQNFLYRVANKNAPSLEAWRFTSAIDKNAIICTHIEQSILYRPLKFGVGQPSVLKTTA